MSLDGRPPEPKPEKVKPDPAYLAAVRELSCCICEAWGMRQISPTTAHHPIMDRFSTRKTPDRMAIPLCDGHHQGTFDTSRIAVHREPKAWREAYGADHEWVAVTQDKIEAKNDQYSLP